MSTEHDPFAETPANCTTRLLVAETLDWAPHSAEEWNDLPSWRAWRAEVHGHRRPPNFPDPLLEAAHWEAHALLSSRSGNPLMAAYYFALADEAIHQEESDD